MTEQEVAKVLYVLNVNYKSDKNTNALDMEKRLKLWAVEFRDEEAWLVELAVKEHISKSEFYPSIASIRKILERLKTENDLLHNKEGHLVPIHIGNKIWLAHDLVAEANDRELTPEEEQLFEEIWKEENS